MSFNSEIKDQITESIPKKDCCKQAMSAGFELLPFNEGCQKDIGCYLRGVFLKCGNVSSPERNFMLSLVFQQEKDAERVEQMLEEAGLNFEIAGAGLTGTDGAYAFKQSILPGTAVEPAAPKA